MSDVLQVRMYEQLEDTPERRCIGFLSPDGEVSWRTWETFFRHAAGRAARMQAEGLGPGDVCVLVLQSKEFCASALLAALMTGAIPLLVAPPVIQGANTSLGRILLRTVRKTRAKLVVADASLLELRDRLERSRRGTRYVFGVHALDGGDPSRVSPVAPARDDWAAYQLTSGTTGFPRVCMWKQHKVVAALDAMMGAMRLGRDDVCFNWTPLYHDMGLVNNFFLCLANGIPLVMLSPQAFVKRPALWLRGLATTGSTVTWSPNFGYAITTKMARDRDLEGVRLDHVRAFWNAAERIHLDTVLAFRDRFAAYGVRPDALKTNFGCAENVGGATFTDVDGSFAYEWVDRMALQEKRQAIPTPPGENAVAIVGAGRPAPGLEVHILSRTGRRLPDGHVGEVALHTPSRMEGYLDNQKATRRAICGDLLRTGDLGYVRDRELFWVGRVRERINVFGKKLDPSDFERALLHVEGLRPGCFAAFGVDDEGRGTQRIVVVSEVREPLARDVEALADDVRERLQQELGIDVSEVLLVPKGTLTKTSSGKRRHRHFRELYLEGRLQDNRLQLQNA